MTQPPWLSTAWESLILHALFLAHHRHLATIDLEPSNSIKRKDHTLLVKITERIAMARGREEEFLDAEMVRACRSADTELIDYVLNRSEKGRENRYLVVGMYTAIKTKHIDIMK